MAGKSDLPSKKHTFGPDRTLEDSAGAKGKVANALLTQIVQAAANARNGAQA